MEKKNDTQARVRMDISLDQAQMLRSALDLYVRLGIGQIEQISELVRSDAIPTGSSIEGRPCANTIESLAHQIKFMLGYTPHGSWGVGSDSVSRSAKRAYEMKKTLDRKLAVHQDPSPDFRGVDYDGVTVRYTDDILPSIEVQAPEKPQEKPKEKRPKPK